MTAASPTESRWDRLSALLGGVPSDLVAVSVLAALVTVAVRGTGSAYGWPREVVGLVFVLALPGYAFLAAAFPARPARSVAADERASYSPGTVERLVLSLPVSLALVPLLAVGHGLLGVPFEPRTTATSVAVLVVACSAVAAVRRFARPPDDRYAPPSLTAAGARLRSWVGAGGTVDTALSVLLAASVLLAVGAVLVGVTGPTQGESYTSVSLVTRGDGGELVASNYPTNLTAGENATLTLAVENHYQSRGNYTAVVELQRVDGSGSGTVAVRDRERLRTLAATVPAGENWTATHRIRPTTTGSQLRLRYYVYRGDVPATPSAETADGTAHLWVTVRDRSDG